MVNAYGGGFGSVLGWGYAGYGMVQRQSVFNTVLNKPDDTSHAIKSDNVVLTQAYILTVANTVHATKSDNIALTQNHVLAIANALHSLTSDGNLVLAQYFLMNKPDDSVISLTSDTIAIAQVYILTVDDSKIRQTTSLLKLIDWNELEYYFGAYKRDSGELGGFQEQNLPNSGSVKQTFRQVGELTETEPDTGRYKPNTKNKPGVY